jgi:hypothetical protein
VGYVVAVFAGQLAVSLPRDEGHCASDGGLEVVGGGAVPKRAGSALHGASSEGGAGWPLLRERSTVTQGVTWASKGQVSPRMSVGRSNLFPWPDLSP